MAVPCNHYVDKELSFKSWRSPSCALNTVVKLNHYSGMFLDLLLDHKPNSSYHILEIPTVIFI